MIEPLKAWPATGALGAATEIESCEYMFQVTLCVWDRPPLSVAMTVNVKAPDRVGVPVTAPVLPFKDSPAGKDPAKILYAFPPLPPVTEIEPLKA